MFSIADNPRAKTIPRMIELWAVCPALGGIWLRARPSPVRDDVLRLIKKTAGTQLIRIHPAIGDEALFGGLDISATLAAGRPIETKGLLEKPKTPLLLTQAQSLDAPLAARIAKALDEGATAVALDEGTEDEGLATSLQDRLAFAIDLENLHYDALEDIQVDMVRILAARARFGAEVSPEHLIEMTEIAGRVGMTSLRIIQMALRCAKAAAALDDLPVTPDHLAEAAALIFGPRCLEPIVETEEEPEHEVSEPSPSRETAMLEDQVLEAVQANLPSAALLTFLQAQAAQRQMGGFGAGSRKRGNRRGRPIAPRPGLLTNGARLDILTTLRRAVPWQRIRARTGPISLRAEDFAIKRFEVKSDRLIVFSVDASGSSAAKRLAEAKGAVEALLAEAYARRDHVALVAFRKEGAELLLPPTRSLVQAKKRLGSLPGGGGTPLASGLQSGFLLALNARKRGMSPAFVLLSDGGANIALDGTPGRKQAQSDAQDVARHFAHQNVPTLTVDTGRRPDATLQAIAKDLGGSYFPLPNADAAALSRSLRNAVLDG
ncbi:MAG: VWA domain-containing protein [Pseudomonadota bacterium]